MTAAECHRRAGVCAANAELAANESVAQEFLRLAAQWRAMAGRTIFLGSAEAMPAIPTGSGTTRLT
jgi:hypothetical protein